VIRCVDVLAPSDLYLFHKLKEFMKGHKVSKSAAVKDNDMLLSIFLGH